MPLGRCLVALGLAAAAQSGMAASAVASGFVASAQARSVELDITQTTLACTSPQSCSVTGTSTQSDSESAPGFAPFMATAQVPPFTSFAQQDSSIDTTRIEASGSGETTGSGGFAAPPNNFIITDSEAASRFSATFAVASATPYRLKGSVTVTGGLSASALARIRLKTAGGAVVDEVSVQTDPECQFTECALVEEALHSIGVLAPGSYVLEAETSGTATPFFFAGNFFGLTSTGQYEVELTPTEVPALSRGALAALALGLGLAGAAAARRR